MIPDNAESRDNKTQGEGRQRPRPGLRSGGRATMREDTVDYSESVPPFQGWLATLTFPGACTPGSAASRLRRRIIINRATLLDYGELDLQFKRLLQGGGEW